MKASGAIYYGANKEAVRERIRRCNEQKADHYRDLRSRWKRENKSAVNASTHRRRARLKGNGGSWTAEEWEALKARFDYRCLSCGRREPEIALTVDHVIPVDAGGPNVISNLQPLCKSCNSKKHRKPVDFRNAA